MEVERWRMSEKKKKRKTRRSKSVSVRVWRSGSSAWGCGRRWSRQDGRQFDWKSLKETLPHLQCATPLLWREGRGGRGEERGGGEGRGEDGERRRRKRGKEKERKRHFKITLIST